jgi:hypothetical protein
MGALDVRVLWGDASECYEWISVSAYSFLFRKRPQFAVNNP